MLENGIEKVANMMVCKLMQINDCVARGQDKSAYCIARDNNLVGMEMTLDAMGIKYGKYKDPETGMYTELWVDGKTYEI